MGDRGFSIPLGNSGFINVPKQDPVMMDVYDSETATALQKMYENDPIQLATILLTNGNVSEAHQ